MTVDVAAPTAFTLPSPGQPVSLPAAAETARNRLRSWTPRPPSRTAAAAGAGELRSVWNATKSLDSAERRLVRRLPWLLFARREDGPRLADDVHFVKASLARIKDMKDGAAAALLIAVILRDYPDDATAFRPLLKGLRDLVTVLDAPELQGWREPVRVFNLLDPKGPRLFADQWLSSAMRSDSLFAAARLSPPLDRGRFAEKAFAEMLNRLDAPMSGDEADVTARAVLVAARRKEGLRFPAKEPRAALAGALRRVLDRPDTLPETRERIAAFLREFG